MQWRRVPLLDLRQQVVDGAMFLDRLSDTIDREVVSLDASPCGDRIRFYGLDDDGAVRKLHLSMV